MSSEDNDGRPMNEAEWELVLRQRDPSSAKFEAVIEALEAGDLRRARLVAREMGLSLLLEGLLQHPAISGDDPFPDESQVLEHGDINSSDDDGEEPEDVVYDDEEDDDLEITPSEAEIHCRENLFRIPAYLAVRSVESRIRDAVWPLVDVDDHDPDPNRLAGEAYMAIHQADSLFAAGHSMGYDDDVLCGHIVKI